MKLSNTGMESVSIQRGMEFYGTLDIGVALALAEKRIRIAEIEEARALAAASKARQDRMEASAHIRLFAGGIEV